MVYKQPTPKTSSTCDDGENNKARHEKSTVPGGGGFGITKKLVQLLKQTSSNANTDSNDQSNANDKEPDISIDKDEVSKPEKPKYDWGLAPGRSMQSTEIIMEAEEKESLEPLIEPEYHILGERNAIIYSLDTTEGQIEDLPDSFYDLTVNDLKLVLRDLKKIAAGNADSPLLTEKLRDIEDTNTMLKKIAQYKNCVIRIQFPDRYVLQGMFKPIEKISDIKEFITSFLVKPDKSFYLFTIPPKAKLELEKTLLELDFVPNALLHFSFEDETDEQDKFIKPHFLDKLTTAEGAFYAASKLRKEKQSRSHNDGASSSVLASTGAIPKRPRNDKMNN